MATLESAFNPTYSENASILTGNPDRVSVEVEDNIDADFWRDLLEELCPKKEFHFDPYHTIIKDDGVELKVRGKARIMKAAETFNEWHIGCVDSDYDWLLSGYTDDDKKISENKYLLQTYAYSIENLMCCPEALSDFCADITEERVDFDFSDYMSRLSHSIYPLLVWSAYLCSKGKEDFTPASWRKIIVNTLTEAEEALRHIEKMAKEKIYEIERVYTDEISDKEKLMLSISESKDVKEDTAYLYVRGHDLQDHLQNSVLNPIISSLRKKHYETLNDTNLEKAIRITALQEYQKKDKPIKEQLSKNYRYKNYSLIYDMIKSDVLQIWEEPTMA